MAEGKTASFVLLRGNPLQDICNAEEIESVLLRGFYLDSDKIKRIKDDTERLCLARS